ncbi:MAG: hypothetical protein LUG90_07460 [Clostridiaceae bacterium]|nr:hypothetical protein [Clostridiaceae bacterium]
MKVGWVCINGIYYYLSESGAMITGWLFLDNIWYYMSESGGMVIGWKQIDGKWYYFESAGKMLTDTLTPDNYYVDSNGVCLNHG